MLLGIVGGSGPGRRLIYEKPSASLTSAAKPREKVQPKWLLFSASLIQLRALWIGLAQP